MEISAFYWIVNEYNCLEQNVDLAKNVLFYWEMQTEDCKNRSRIYCYYC